MTTSMKGITGGKPQYGITKSLEAFYQRVIKISVESHMPYEMFEHGLPYEASKTYRAMKSEFECRRSAAVVEAHRQALRGY